MDPVLRYVENLVFVVIALSCLRGWRRERERSDRWAAAAFGSIGFVGLCTLALPPAIAHTLGPDAALHWVYKVLIAVLLAFPYLLVRFLDSLDPVSAGQRRLAAVLVTATSLATFALPRIPGSHDHRRPGWYVAFLALVVVEWGWLSGFACFRFLAAGRGQPTVVRRRMQVLSLGSLALIVSLIPSLSTRSSESGTAQHIAGQLIGLAAGLLFYLGIAPPTLLRAVWRRPEERSLRRAEMRLMTGATVAAVGSAVLPHLPQLFGGRVALLLDRDHHLIGSYGTSGREQDEAVLLAVAQRDPARKGDPEGGVTLMGDGLLGVPLRNGTLIVDAGAYTPFFGREEVDILHNLGAFIDLALARAELFERERDARLALEVAHQELEDLVYSLSHDLKSPLISLLGYLDYLKVDCGESLGPTGTFYLERMGASAGYMTALIEDLLSLSRIGRTQTETEDVDLNGVLEEVRVAAAGSAPDAVITADPLPTLSLSPLRTRELFTNLVDNALRHGGRPDLAIRVWSELTESGDVAVHVADDGVGVPECYREKIFGIFERLGPTDAGINPGTGIGLAMCRKIAEQAGGTISVSDTDPAAPEGARGATFSVVYPAALLRARQQHAPVRTPALP